MENSVMSLAKAEEKDGRLVLRIPCRYEGQSTRRYGETTIRFRVDEGYLPYALRAAIGVDKIAVAGVLVKGQKLPVGKVIFGGLRIDRTGESVLSLDTTAEDLKLPTNSVADLADEDISLFLSIKTLSNNGKGT
jgi:hypothetical protein